MTPQDENINIVVNVDDLCLELKLAHQFGFNLVFGTCTELSQGGGCRAVKEKEGKTMTDEEKEFLSTLRVELQEINLWMRHQEVAWWALTAILLPITAGAFYAVISPSISAPFVLIIGIAIIVMWTLYILLTKYVYYKSNKFRKYANEIKKDLQVENLQDLEDKKFPRDCFEHGIDLGGFISCMFILVLIILGWVFYLDCFSKMDIQGKNKTSTTIEREVPHD